MSVRVAIATCRGEDVDPDSPLLLRGCAAAGLDADLVIWDDPSVAWNDYDLTVIRSTWDYAPRREEFLDWAASVERLWNPLAAVRWSSDKHYLSDLRDRGHAIVPTSFCDRGDEPQFPAGDFVVKPAVGAGSMDAERYPAGDVVAARAHVASLHQRGRDVLIQPYVTSIDHEGETAIIFIGGEFSHAMNKGAMLTVTELDRNALYRREQMRRVDAPASAIDVAQRVLSDCAFGELLYARVDLVDSDGTWSVMEVELVEPSLFLWAAPEATTTLVRAISRRASDYSPR